MTAKDVLQVFCHRFASVHEELSFGFKIAELKDQMYRMCLAKSSTSKRPVVYYSGFGVLESYSYPKFKVCACLQELSSFL
jgi:hypothetical protein